MLEQRIIDYYHHAIGAGKPEVSIIWGTLIDSHHKLLVRALEMRDVEAVAAEIRKPTVLYGVEGELLDRVQFEGRQGAQILRRLGWRIGEAAVPNPEQPGEEGDWWGNDTVKLRDRIEKVLGSLDVPEVFERGITGVSNAFLHSLAQCYTLLLFCRPTFPRRVLEIGSGLCMFAIAAERFGTAQYTAVDLPTTGMVGAFSLASVIGEGRVWMCGEKESATAFARLYPSARRLEVEGPFDVVVQSNGFPEMTDEEQRKYLALVERVLVPGGVFYSINHESDAVGQRSVQRAMKEHGKFRLRYRAPFMLRAGYMEEIWEL